MNRLLTLTSLTSWKEFLPVLLVSLLAAFTGLALLGASAWLVASAAKMPPLYTLAIGITTVRACGIGRAVFRYGERYLSHRMAFRILTEIRLGLYDLAARKLPLRSGMARQGEFLHDLLTGADELRDFYVRALLPIVTTGLMTLLAAWLLAKTLGLIVCLLPAAYLLLLFFSCWRRHIKEHDRREQDAAYRSALLDIRAGADELICAEPAPALFRLQEPAERLLAGDAELAGSDRQRDTRLQILEALLLLLFFALLIGKTAAGELSGIDLCVWYLVLQTLFTEWQAIPDAVRQGRRSLKAAGQLPDKQEMTPAAGQKNFPGSKAAPLLAARHLSFSYQPGQELLRDLSFAIAPGQHTAIIGASGSGKTTLAQLLLAVWPPDQGELLLNGISYASLRSETIRQHITAMPQGSVLFAQSIRENFRRYRPECSEAAINEALADAQLASVVRAMPQGLDTPIGEDASSLSGGQRNRLLTALAIAGKAPLILLDEPTCGLDEKLSAALMDNLFARVRRTGQTLLVITHERDLLPRFEQVITLDA